MVTHDAPSLVTDSERVTSEAERDAVQEYCAKEAFGGAT